MPLGCQIVLAVLLDLLIGDPRWFPHPVKYIGRLALFLEAPVRGWCKNPKIAGIVTAVIIITGAAGAAYALIAIAGWVHPLASDIMSVLLIYTGIAARDLLKHAMDVYRALKSGNLPEARTRVGMICGRDTAELDETQIVRATVESVAENMVDGVTAPLFFAAIGGPVGIIAYKAISTLDSTFGYKNERYRDFGWASAKLDDVAAFVPSRLTALLVPWAALLLGQRARSAVKIFLRDRNKHPSPNAGQAEAAVAGALGVRLGGLSYYEGHASHKQELGDPLEPLERAQIFRASVLMLVTSLMALVLLLGCRVLID